MINETEVLNESNLKMWADFLDKSLNSDPKWTPIVLSCSMLVIFVVSLTGNLLTCIVIYYDKSMHTATNYYLFNLAVSDLIITFAILLEVYEHMSDAYQFGHLACKIHFFLVIMLWNNSVWIMTALAVERYIAIWYPLLINSTPVWRRVMKIIAFIWFVAIAETLPELWTVDLIQTKHSSICFTVPTTFARIVNGVLALFNFIIPLAIMIFVYTMIAFKVNVIEKSNSRDKIFNHRKNSNKVNKLIALTLSFVVCWLPFFTLRVLISILDMHRLLTLAEWWGIWQRVAAINSWFSIVLNPVLFSLISTKFRRALKILWNKKIKFVGHSEVAVDKV